MVSLLENTNIEFASPFRYRTHVEEKKVICRLLARRVIKDNQALFIDPSTTTAYLPNYLSERQNVKVITDNLQFAIAANQMTNLNLFLLVVRYGLIPIHYWVIIQFKILRCLDRS
ncbi:Transcriptional regulator of rhamnoseutilization DeoR family [Lactiplantibacillus plantarum]|uniref:Transcriptional regulator of rhamnoseutilization DeoR family n=1 Tax=Lactiplantibacillus plantarum TaxID=1590 RepID=A0AAW3REX5_LACPN|nr:Transcriptional regulator of rhamnoseutilization DeoR family [Lactiplantibacillus plantarum]